MSYLINDNLIWIITPKCASYSIENAILNSNLKIKKFSDDFYGNKHIHISLNTSLEYFGNKESICITRNWFDKWLSSINYIWDLIEYETKMEPICKWEDLNNELIYNILDTNFINNLHLVTEEGTLKCFLNFLIPNQEKLLKITKLPILLSASSLVSEKYWKSNRNCTYEFDIKDLDKFVNFIENRFGEKLIIERINKSTKRPNKIIINDELKQWVWDNFEKRFEKRNELI
jgi:hypothetical protein